MMFKKVKSLLLAGLLSVSLVIGYNGGNLTYAASVDHSSDEIFKSQIKNPKMNENRYGPYKLQENNLDLSINKSSYNPDEYNIMLSVKEEYFNIVCVHITYENGTVKEIPYSAFTSIGGSTGGLKPYMSNETVSVENMQNIEVYFEFNKAAVDNDDDSIPDFKDDEIQEVIIDPDTGDAISLGLVALGVGASVAAVIINRKKHDDKE